MIRPFRSLVLLLGVAALAACATSHEPKIDVGQISGNVYTNRELGFRVTLPTGWMFLAPERLESAVASALAASPDPPSQESVARTRTLFGMVDLAHPPAPGVASRSLAATVESLEGTAGITSETYAAAIQMAAATSPDLIAKFGQWYRTKLAGKDFVVLPSRVQSGEVRAHQDSYVYVADGYALGLIVVYPETEDEVPPEILDSIQAFP